MRQVISWHGPGRTYLTMCRMGYGMRSWSCRTVGMVPSLSRPTPVGAGSEPAPTGPAPTGPAPTGPAPTGPGFTKPASRGPVPTELSSVRSHQGDMAEIQKDYGWYRDFSASSLGGAMCDESSLWRLDKEVGGALIPNSMQRVSKCKRVGFCRAAAR